MKFVFSFVPREAKCSDYKIRLQYRFCSPILNVIECRVVTNEKKKVKSEKYALFQSAATCHCVSDE